MLHLDAIVCEIMTIRLRKIAVAINSALPANLPDEMRKTVQIVVQSVIEKMKLVTREEIYEQEEELLQLREKIEVMEVLVSSLERQKKTADK